MSQPPSDILTNVARGWSRDPSGVALGTNRTGVPAAIWSDTSDRTREVLADPSNFVHIAMQLRPVNPEMQIDSERYVLQGPAGTLNIARSRARPSAIVHGHYEVLHFYLPEAILRTLVENEHWSIAVSGLELIDPRGAPDPFTQ